MQISLKNHLKRAYLHILFYFIVPIPKTALIEAFQPFNLHFVCSWVYCSHLVVSSTSGTFLGSNDINLAVDGDGEDPDFFENPYGLAY